MPTSFRLLAPLVALLLLTGCASNYYNVPRESFEKKVRVLGVAPIFVDTESDIRHPDREALIGIVKEYNRKNEREMVRRLKESGAFFTVALLDSDADQLFSGIFSRREQRDDGGIIYNKYFFKDGDIQELLRKNGLDAILLMVVSGINKQDTQFSSNLLSRLETGYNSLIMTGQVLDSERTILWEYPNFRRTPLSMTDLLGLQYPDFDEATANLSDKVEVKFKTIPGITRAFLRKDKDILLREQPVSAIYSDVFSDMVKTLAPGKGFFSDWGKSEPAAPSR